MQENADKNLEKLEKPEDPEDPGEPENIKFNITIINIIIILKTFKVLYIILC